MAATKELVRLGVTDHARALQRLSDLRQSVFSSEDAKEGALALRREAGAALAGTVS